MAWHLGYPLAQTLLTSVYVEALTSPAPRYVDQVRFARASSEMSREPPFLFILRAYCAGLLKTCDMVNAIMAEELYYEVLTNPTLSNSASLRLTISRRKILSGILVTGVCYMRYQHRM